MFSCILKGEKNVERTMKFKKVLGVVASAGALTTSVALPVFASDDLYGFSMNLGLYQEEASTGYRYRQTASTNSPWKSAVNTSTEGTASYYSAYLMG